MGNINKIPSSTGVYVLVLKCKGRTRVPVGSLGTLTFADGVYCYVGSAAGARSMNLSHRLGHHLNRDKACKLWHIDYLTAHTNFLPTCAVLAATMKRAECHISRELSRRADATILAFGSSDCQCNSHLSYFARRQGKDLVPMCRKIFARCGLRPSVVEFISRV